MHVASILATVLAQASADGVKWVGPPEQVIGAEPWLVTLISGVTLGIGGGLVKLWTSTTARRKAREESSEYQALPRHGRSEVEVQILDATTRGGDPTLRALIREIHARVMKGGTS